MRAAVFVISLVKRLPGRRDSAQLPPKIFASRESLARLGIGGVVGRRSRLGCHGTVAGAAGGEVAALFSGAAQATGKAGNAHSHQRCAKLRNASHRLC